MTSPFAQPQAGGDKFDLKNSGQSWLGTLMLIYPKELKPQFDSGQFEPTDVVVADIVFVDGPEAGRNFNDAFLFAKFIVSDIKGMVGTGDPVLGRLGQKQGKQGLGWAILEHTQQDQALALPVHARYMSGTFNQPVTVAVGASGNMVKPDPVDPWAGVNAAPAPTPTLPAAVPAATAAPATDPNVGALIAKGLDPTQVLAMDPSTRAAVLATYA